MAALPSELDLGSTLSPPDRDLVACGAQMPPKRKLAGKKGKTKKAAAPPPPPPPPPPPDPRLLLVEALLPKYGQKLQPPDPSQAYHGYEAELPTYPEPGQYTGQAAVGGCPLLMWRLIIAPTCRSALHIQNMQRSNAGVAVLSAAERVIPSLCAGLEGHGQGGWKQGQGTAGGAAAARPPLRPERRLRG